MNYDNERTEMININKFEEKANEIINNVKMKNIHLIETDQPSRLFLNKVNNKLLLEDISNPSLKNVLPSGDYQNIYITSSEQIKEYDYFLNTLNNAVLTNLNIINSKHLKKIILTTDQDLIKNDVQAIDDEFLEWFVKNPSCEVMEVEIDEFYSKKAFINNEDAITYSYKIIIPSEESKVVYPNNKKDKP